MPLCDLTFNLVYKLYVTFVPGLAFNSFAFLVSYEQVRTRQRDGQTYDHSMLLNVTSQ